MAKTTRTSLRDNMKTPRVEFTLTAEALQCLKDCELRHHSEYITESAERVMHSIVGGRRGVITILQTDLQQFAVSIQRCMASPAAEDYIRVDLIRIATELERTEDYIVVEPTRK